MNDGDISITTPAPTRGGAGRTIAKHALLALIVLAGAFSDLGTKQWATANLKGRSPVTLISGFVDLGFAENRGMVFGLLNDGKPHAVTGALTVARFLILAAVMAFLFWQRRRPFLFLLPFAIIAGGAWGNCIDGVLAGHVTDFIHIRLGSILDWPFYFNLADAYLCVGVGMLLVMGVPGKGGKTGDRIRIQNRIQKAE